ncbi:hypothetical protein WA026_013978 [Henosepilachna vigintioctopunctata]|uniref:Uncharacterized protein n=1 Tax=Henosepilachna vigintioctopunctata TaxID=420089 RepID=A0AAW1UBD1_9CUCU
MALANCPVNLRMCACQDSESLSVNPSKSTDAPLVRRVIVVNIIFCVFLGFTINLLDENHSVAYPIGCSFICSTSEPSLPVLNSIVSSAKSTYSPSSWQK